ncbi:hypothetical protein F0L68_35315 [Solihabitans fulvus]|uniref:Uncharacterized protein n=2 Tax=Solihabitans fulvus TaxID=1892852 RepID=A0A5B2WLF9_9PSEU|nr:hypothetical protein F0L68_35315 [Solihabitans fulvus]
MPPWTEEQFSAILAAMVADHAPRVFAVVQECGERLDGRIAAWGFAFEDHAEIIGVRGDLRMRLSNPEDALPGFRWNDNLTPRLIWLDPDATLPAHAPETSKS